MPPLSAFAGAALVVVLGIVHVALHASGSTLHGALSLYIAAVLLSGLYGGIVPGIVAAVAAVPFLALGGSLPGGVGVLILIAGLFAVAWAAGAIRRRRLPIYDDQAERILAQTVVDRYRTLFMAIGAIVWEFDVESKRVVFASSSAQDILKRPLEAFLESPTLWIEAQHPDDLPRTLEVLARMEAGSTDENLEHRMLTSDGRSVWLYTAVRGGKSAEGRTVLRGVSIDVTAHKLAQQDLQRAVSLNAATLESTADGILVVDRNGRITSFNRKFVEMWRIPEEVIRTGEDEKAIAVVLDQLADSDAFLAKVRELYEHPDASSSDSIAFKDGRVFERYSQPQKIGDECVGRVWSFRDVTDRKRAELAVQRHEEQLRLVQKMEAVGLLAGGVAHDFNNILTTVLGNVSLILEDTHVSHELRQRALDIETAAQRAAGLTGQLLALSRRQMLELRVLDLNVILEDMQKLFRVTLGEQVVVVLRVSQQPCRVLVDRGQIEQVLLNLALNARDAMPQGGRLTITTRVVAMDAGPRREAAPSSERTVMLTVADTGIGMDEQTRLRIFEPFFTTKDRGKGTGLGLATAYGIIRQLGGRITVRSAPGSGTTFDIELPYSDRPVDPPKPVPPRPARPTGFETLLVVEDEAPVRALMCDALRRAGYHVLQADGGPSALHTIDGHAGSLDLLVTDVVMPGMSGRELANQMLSVRHDLRVLFISGYAEDDLVPPGASDPSVSLLRKPFTTDALVRRVREMLDAPRRALRAERRTRA
jgi:PAS domain S-box-containing protein